MIYAQFYYDEDHQILGSDGIMPYLDQRKKTSNLISDVRDRLRNHFKREYITGFRIFRTQSLRVEGTPITEWMEK